MLLRPAPREEAVPFLPEESLLIFYRNEIVPCYSVSLSYFSERFFIYITSLYRYRTVRTYDFYFSTISGDCKEKCPRCRITKKIKSPP